MNRRDALFTLTSTSTAAAATAATGLFSQAARAQGAWPARNVTVVVPFAPGGAGNGSVRILAEVIGPQMGQSVLVENRPGGGGVPGTQHVAQSSDDHLLLMGSTSMTILPALRNDLAYDVMRDLQPVGMISSQPQVVAVGVNSPLRTLDDLVAQGRGGKLTAGNSGVGTLSHLATELLNRKLGTSILPVPYKGDAVLMPDVAAGTLSMGIINLPVVMPLIQAGRLRALAVTSAQPVASLPGVPLLRALGEEFVITGWAAMYASRAVPVAGVERFSTLMRNALGEAGVRERFAAFGVTPEPTTPAQLREFTRGEIARWGDVVRSRGITLS
jgi:tripartite-type tricarboxylate transporter receptor subunit TctC